VAIGLCFMCSVAACVEGSSAEGRSKNKGKTADCHSVSGTGYTYLPSSGQTDHKCVNKLARPREWGVPLGLFSINHTDSGFFWLNPKLSLDRGNHVTSNTVQFQPCLHESNSLMAPRSPHGRNQQNSFFFFFTRHDISLYLPWVTNLWAANLQDLEEMNYEFERETGFINSQPSLAECLTSFPPVGDAFQSSSIKSSTLSHSTLIPPPFEQTIPSLNPGSHPRHSRPKQNPNGSCPLPAASLPPEYPWMKEKKASKKNQTTSTATTTDPGPLYFSPQGIWI